MKRSKLFALISLVLVLCAFATSFFACDVNKPQRDERSTDIQDLSGDELVSKSMPIVKWEGRYEYRDERVYLYHTATGFTVDFIGSELYVGFNADIAGGDKNRKPYYNVAVDGETLPNTDEARSFCLSQGEQTVAVAQGLRYGKHTIKCLKTSEPYDAVTSVTSFKTDGEFLLRDKQYDEGAYRFMFVCASGGSGHGALGYTEKKNSYAPRTTANSSSLYSFNYLTAKMFGADVQFVANSGWGVGWKNNCPKSVAEALDYTGITVSDDVKGAKSTALWDYGKWVPDVIIFNIGGNDTTKNDFDLKYYQDKVVETVRSLHGHYPKADMIWTHTGSNAGSYAVAAMTNAGILREGYMRVLATMPNVGEGATGKDTYGANRHSSLKTHIDIADLLGEMLQELGYTKQYANIDFADYENSLVKF